MLQRHCMQFCTLNLILSVFYTVLHNKLGRYYMYTGLPEWDALPGDIRGTISDSSYFRRQLKSSKLIILV